MCTTLAQLSPHFAALHSAHLADAKGPLQAFSRGKCRKIYWSGTAFNSNEAWNFNFNLGGQVVADKINDPFAWAVRPGDVAAAPEPASLLLFGVGVLGLGWSWRRGRRR